MVDSISKVPGRRESGATRNRTQASPAFPADGHREGGGTRERRIEAMLAVLANLTKGEDISKAKFEVEQDQTTGAVIYRAVDPETGRVIAQWSTETLAALRKTVSEMEGMLVDKTV